MRYLEKMAGILGKEVLVSYRLGQKPSLSWQCQFDDDRPRFSRTRRGTVCCIPVGYGSSPQKAMQHLKRRLRKGYIHFSDMVIPT